MNGLFRRSRFVWGANDWTTDLSAKPWTPVASSVGGSRTSAAGIPASYKVREDDMVDLTIRVGEAEWEIAKNLVLYGQSSQSFLWYPDVDESLVMTCYLEAPLAGTEWAPNRISDFQRVFELNIRLRAVAGSPIWRPYFEDASLVTDLEIAFATATPNTIGALPVGVTQEILVQALNSAIQVIPGTTTVFTSEDPSIATVNPETGVVSGTGTGSTTIIPIVNGTPVTPVPVTVTAPPAGSLYWDDDQAGGVFGPDVGGYGWGDLSGGAYNPAPSVVADADSPTGFAVRFRFNPTTGGSRTEARLHYGAQLTDVYIGYSIKFPLNYFHRNGPSSDNNKMIRVWGNAYSVSEGNGDPGIKVGFSTNPTSTGSSYFQFGNETFGRTEGDGHKLTTWVPPTAPGVNLATDLGAYQRWVFHCKVASGPNALDGEVELWVDGVVRWSKKNADLWDYSPVKYNYFDKMYLLGAANSGFNVVTDILIQGVKIGPTYNSVA